MRTMRAAHHLTRFLLQTSAVGALAIGEGANRDANGRSSEGMSFTDGLETSRAFG